MCRHSGKPENADDNDPRHGLSPRVTDSKEAANIIKDVVPLDWEGKEIGMTGFRSKVADHVFVVEDKIYLDRKVPDLTEERPIHVMTRQGERTSLKRTDIVEDVTVSFTVRRLCGGKVPEPAFVACLQYGMELGFGADRSQGKGKYIDLKVNKLRGPGTKEPKLKGLKSKKGAENEE